MDIPTRENNSFSQNSEKSISELRYKLKNMPHIFYLNLDKREDRKQYIEKQFKLLNIKNFTRISADRFSVETFNVWKNKITPKPINEIPRLSTLLNHLQIIIDWHDSNSSEYCIIAEDDVNFLSAKFWPFTWEYFVSRLPCNWDCVQLHVIGEYFVPMGLSNRFNNNHSAACYLINRRFSSKLKQMHYDNDRFKFYKNYGYDKTWPEYHYQSADFIPYEVGVTYTFPLFITNSDFISDSYVDSKNIMCKKSDLVTFSWWKKLKESNYTLDDIFLRDSEKRRELNLKVSY
jgi:hypothetical protein